MKMITSFVFEDSWMHISCVSRPEKTGCLVLHYSYFIIRSVCTFVDLQKPEVLIDTALFCKQCASNSLYIDPVSVSLETHFSCCI